MKRLFVAALILLMSFSFISCEKKTAQKDSDSVEKITREELSFGIKDFEVKGELTKPKDGKEPFKLVVIVGGSGPTNRDASINSYHPYKDIAEGLAEKGIATFRYDKRAASHKDKFNEQMILDTTIKEEYLDDYNEVMKFLSTRKDLDKNNIYTMGHSQGGYIIPMLEKTNNTPKGYIFAAAPSRHIEDSMIEQCGKILATPNITDEMKKQYTTLKEQAEKVKTLTAASPDAIIAGAGTKYWIDLQKYNVTEEVKNVNKPIIFLQGTNDFNVTEEDFNRFKEVLKGKENAEFKSYEGLTHMFTKGQEITVDKSVINDIATFVNK